jgi:epoxyqueuosine reductase
MMSFFNTREGDFPSKEKRLLIHSCCAPCTGGILQQLHNTGIECTLFFYNPNIEPEEEYELRKQAERQLAMKFDVPFISGLYEPTVWLNRIHGLENEPERGRRCQVCFEVRLERTALFAYENQFKVFTSSLGLSRHKDLTMVNACGLAAAARYSGLMYWTINWRKKGGAQLSDKIANEEHLYRQNYCGCVFSRQGTIGSTNSPID